MDIKEIINYSKIKIEADDLAKQVRRRIKETTWEKQNQREGFSETFKPLISQFEKPEDSKKENIFTQNQEMLRNQLALTEGLRANQKAITDGFSQFERLADMRELPQIEEYDDNYDPYYEYFLREKQIGEELESKEKVKTLDIENDFNEEQIKIIEDYGFKRPSYLLNLNKEDIQKEIDNLPDVISKITKSINGRKNKQMPTKSYKKETTNLNHTKNILQKYQQAVADYIRSIPYQKKGEGIMNYFSPQELLKMFELLGGSLAAGKNGVLHEYIQIAHRLRDLGIVTNKQLNKILRII